MYKSPIDLIIADVQTKILEQQENQVFQAIQNVGVNVDKEELKKALAYDRDQYQVGYSDGYTAGAMDMKVKLIDAFRGKIPSPFLEILLGGENR